MSANIKPTAGINGVGKANVSSLTTKRRISRGQRPARVDFKGIAQSALAVLPDLCARWLPNGHQSGTEWISSNPRRADRHPGSFSVSLHSGKWADFATDARGGDVISLASYLFELRPVDAAKRIAEMLGMAVSHA